MSAMAEFQRSSFGLAVVPLMTVAGVLPADRRAPRLNIDGGPVAIRIAQNGWVIALMGIYSSIGEVEDGIRTLS